MSNLRETGALITGDPSEAADALADGQVVSTTFGPRIYAIHVLRGQESIMASIKGRENGKPFVVTTHPDFIETALLSNPSKVGIDPTTEPIVLNWFKKLLTSTKDQPVGVLLPSANEPLTVYQVGTGNIKVKDVPQRTVGFMTPGSDSDYLGFIEQIMEKFVSSTSVNRGGDLDAGGSGHHRLYGLVQDFGQDDRVSVLVPKDWSEETRSGVSTTTFFLNQDGARLVRVGSIPKSGAIELCGSLDIPYMGEIDGGARHISAFDYSNRSLETAMAAAYEFIHTQAHRKSFVWTAEAGRQCESAIAQALLAVDFAPV